jgi:hypothetical protein
MPSRGPLATTRPIEKFSAKPDVGGSASGLSGCQWPSQPPLNQTEWPKAAAAAVAGAAAAEAAFAMGAALAALAPPAALGHSESQPHLGRIQTNINTYIYIYIHCPPDPGGNRPKTCDCLGKVTPGPARVRGAGTKNKKTKCPSKQPGSGLTTMANREGAPLKIAALAAAPG